MLGKKKVDFKGTKNGIVLQYSEQMSYDDLHKLVGKKLQKAGDFFKGAHMIGIDGPPLTEDQEDALKRLIESTSGMKVLTLECIEKEVPQADDRVEIHFEAASDQEINEPVAIRQMFEGTTDESRDPKETGASHEPPVFEDVAEEASSVACHETSFFHRGTLRSGRRIDSKGHIIIIGDVNPGAELHAVGNIIVMGSLRGFVHAGCQGDSEACVVALKLHPTQLRIGKYITRPPDGDTQGPDYPELARVKNDQIIIEPHDK